MSVMLHVDGVKLDVKKFFAVTKLEPYEDFYHTIENGEIIPADGSAPRKIAFILCSSERGEFDKDVQNAIQFLKINTNNLQQASNFEGVENLFLNFIINNDEEPEMSYRFVSRFPAELIKLMATYKMGMVILNMPPNIESLGDDDEKTTPEYFA